MKPKTLHQPFELQVSDLDYWKERPLVYHFFEIVQILEVSGTREVNRNYFPYHKGSIFLFTPVDCRGFVAQSATRFCSIRFSEVFFGKYKSVPERERLTQWIRQLEHIFSHHNRFQELVIKRSADCKMIASLMQHMVAEYGQKQPHYEENLQLLVTLILNILARNVSDQPTTTNPKDSELLINHILLHIHQYISNPEKLRIEYLASQFHLSANYVGEYFKKITGESLQHYIMLYKINMVQQRLANSNLTVSQIADELGFTDESHLGRQFRKYKGVSPLEYRKSARLFESIRMSK